MNICKKCGKETKNAKFCSRSCSTSYNNKGVCRNKEFYSKKERWVENGKYELRCNHCDKLFRSNFKTIQYCSFSCQTKNNHTSLREKWINKCEDLQEFYNFHANSGARKAKLYLIEKRGHRCEICKGTVWNDKPIPLVFDHIDGNSGNWKFNNCRLVCGNCDMQLPTYKSKNKKSSRDRRYAPVSQRPSKS